MSRFLPDELKNRLLSKRLIFTVTTGRSGTNYLTKMLGYVPGVDSFGEPEPQFSSVMRSIQKDKSLAYRFLIKEKLPRIAEMPGPVYVETSHLFCKGFVEPLLDIGLVPDLILLKRPHRAVALSLYMLGTIPGRTEKGLKYCLSPEDPDVLPVPGWRALHDYQLCYWYCLEIERRSTAYPIMVSDKGGRVVDVSLDEISTAKGFINLLSSLGLPRPGVLDLVRYMLGKSKPVNTKMDRKKSTMPEEDLDQLEQEVIGYIGRDF